MVINFISFFTSYKMDNTETQEKVEVEKVEKVEVEKVEVEKVVQKKLKKPVLRHSNFYCVLKVNKSDINESKLCDILQKDFFNKLLTDFISLKGSRDGFTKYNLPVDDKRENLLMRLEKKPFLDHKFVNTEKELCFHFVLAFSKRNLDIKLNEIEIKKFLNGALSIPFVFKSKLYKDSNVCLEKYIF